MLLKYYHDWNIIVDFLSTAKFLRGVYFFYGHTLGKLLSFFISLLPTARTNSKWIFTLNMLNENWPHSYLRCIIFCLAFRHKDDLSRNRRVVKNDIISNCTSLESVADPVIQATGRADFEDGWRTGTNWTWS